MTTQRRLLPRDRDLLRVLFEAGGPWLPIADIPGAPGVFYDERYRSMRRLETMGLAVRSAHRLSWRGYGWRRSVAGDEALRVAGEENGPT